MVGFFSVFQQRHRYQTFLVQLLRACHAGLQERQVGAFGLDLVALVSSLRGLLRRLGRHVVGAGFAHASSQLFFVKLRQNLALLDPVAVVQQNLFDDAARLGLDLDLGQRLDFAGGHHRAGNVAAFDLGQPGGVDLMVGAQAGDGQEDHDQAHSAASNEKPTLAVAVVLMVVHHSPLARARVSGSYPQNTSSPGKEFPSGLDERRGERTAGNGEKSSGHAPVQRAFMVYSPPAFRRVGQPTRTPLQ